jgi:V8-like Glu-specific endopeptidase
MKYLRLAAISFAVVFVVLLLKHKEAKPVLPKINLPSPATVIDDFLEVDNYPGFTVVTDDCADTYKCVGEILVTNSRFIGSGTLIAPKVVLTAAHVIKDSELEYFRTNNQCYKIRKSVMHPDYTEEGSGKNDIGLLFLEEACLETPAVLQTDPQELKRGELLTTVGFSHKIKKISNEHTFWYYGTIVEQPTYIRFLAYKGNIWLGDSGGAVFEDGGKLTGVISALMIMEYSVVDQIATRVDLYVPWITQMEKINE